MFRVLVIGNNITRANLTARAVKDLKFGARLNYALSATQAIMYIEGTRTSGKCLPDMIIMSAQLPDITGPEAVNAIHKAIVADNIPIIVVSETKNAQDGREYYKNSASGFVSYSGDPSKYMADIADAVCFVAMMQGLVPKQAKYFPDQLPQLPTISDILQVHL